MPEEVVISQIDTVLEDIGADAVKIGELWSRAICENVADRLEAWGNDRIVVAPGLALLFEAVGGVFIAGGIAPRMVDILQQGAFRDAFDRKAPHHEWARRVPASVIVHPEPALLGLSALVTNPELFVVHVESWQAAN